MHVRLVLGVGMLATAVAAGACGASGPTGPTGTGTLNLRITDSPFQDAKAVLVTFSEVTAHRADDASAGGWTRVAFADGASSRTCDLKKLEGAEDVLGVGALPAGQYTMVRLVVQSASIHFDNPAAGPACAAAVEPPAGRSVSLTIPSGEVKLNRPFTVPEGGATTMLVDFDGDRSIVQQGNGAYRMTPVIGVVSVR